MRSGRYHCHRYGNAGKEGLETIHELQKDFPSVRIMAISGGGRIGGRAPYFEGIVRNARQSGGDVILRGAPHLVVALCDRDFPRGAENAHFAFAYAELFAPTVGVGTCWAGLFQGCAFSGYGPLIEALELPAGKKVAGGLMVGFPRYRYYRLVNRNPLDVTWR
jgi:hypothetical protein